MWATHRDWQIWRKTYIRSTTFRSSWGHSLSHLSLGIGFDAFGFRGKKRNILKNDVSIICEATSPRGSQQQRRSSIFTFKQKTPLYLYVGSLCSSTWHLLSLCTSFLMLKYLQGFFAFLITACITQNSSRQTLTNQLVPCFTDVLC